MQKQPYRLSLDAQPDAWVTLARYYAERCATVSVYSYNPVPTRDETRWNFGHYLLQPFVEAYDEEKRVARCRLTRDLVEVIVNQPVPMPSDPSKWEHRIAPWFELAFETEERMVMVSADWGTTTIFYPSDDDLRSLMSIQRWVQLLDPRRPRLRDPRTGV